MNAPNCEHWTETNGHCCPAGTVQLDCPLRHKRTIHPSVNSDRLELDAARMNWREKVLLWSLVIAAIGVLGLATFSTLQENEREYQISERV